MKDFGIAMIFIAVGLIVIVGAVFLPLYLWPKYSVWQSGMAGQAELAQADYNRQVQVVNAKANLQAQTYNAQSEVIRAKGVSQANNIIKDSITDQYIRYLWVQTLEKGQSNQIIYVPTETGLPLTEAGRAVAPVAGK